MYFRSLRVRVWAHDERLPVSQCKTMACATSSLQVCASGNEHHQHTHMHSLVFHSITAEMGSRKLRLGRRWEREAESAGGKEEEVFKAKQSGGNEDR